MPKVVLAVLVGLAVCQVTIFLTTIYLHRTVAHKAVTMSPGVAFACRLLLWLTTGVRPKQWAGVHRKHHARTDVQGDPHSPVLLGYWQVQLNNVGLYRKTIRDGETIDKYTKDIPVDGWDRILFDHAVIGLSIGIALLCLVLGWQWGLLAAAVHTVSYLALNSAVNAVGHSFGKRPYPNLATNNGWLAWLTAGEGWHNNHHAAPTSARLGLKVSEPDPGWWVIKLLVRCKGAKIRLAELKLKRMAQAGANS